ncbi:MAG: radical SAM protein [Syntrophobacterales bacterium]|nr:radical SAM protein [Syntrophobacterales bacterium]
MNYSGIEKNIETLKSSLSACELCPRMCHVNRNSGERGFCLLASEMLISAHLPHHGEEPPLSGARGAGTIFFSSCNLRCSYCQNYQISHTPAGQSVSVDELVELMFELQNAGCHNIEPVTPTPHLPGIMEALFLARKRGLSLPVVFNCGGYERKESIALLAGQVEIYLPDFKYGSAETARKLSGVGDYPQQAFASLQEMVRQVGDALSLDKDKVAAGGIIVRHLILPGCVENSLEALRLISSVSPFLPLSIMSQYTPIISTERRLSADTTPPLLRRRITKKEYEQVVNAALDMGFAEIYTQDVDERVLNPDFSNENPFDWSATGALDA